MKNFDELTDLLFAFLVVNIVIFVIYQIFTTLPKVPGAVKNLLEIIK